MDRKKDKVVNHHQQVPYRVLEEKYTYNAEKSDNMIIRGDNLEALKALLPKYEGKIKCIYIDPPYNTGEEGWCYNDTTVTEQLSIFVLSYDSFRTSKGDHLDNEESKAKAKIGHQWAMLAGSKYRYFMVFQNKSPDYSGAYSYDRFMEIVEGL